jgi:hypothetical protein
VCLVDHQVRGVVAREAPERVVVPGFGQDDPDVREGRFGKDARDVLVRERLLE